MKIKRILCMAFALVMLLGMAAGMSQTAYAEGNTTEITPTNTSGTMTITLTIAAAHSVTVTPGEHMTKTAGSGEASQSNLSGAMADVVYTANDGYYFPTDYSVATVNGISVTRDSYTQITVSGTPTADAAITLTAPTAKTKPDAPTTAAAVDCTTADNNDGKLTGVTTEMEYKKSDAEEWTAGTGSEITGLVPGTYYVRVKATDTALASDNQELTIRGFISYTVTFKVVNGSWNDEALTGEQTVTLTGHEGDTLKLAENQIPAVGTKPADTYKTGAWDVVPSTETAITAATTYTYTYAAKDGISQTVTFKVVNGSWDNGDTADITVTLSGLEGDTLILAENQIPAVGTKPADTYKAGAWDVVPSTETAITAATTYTYTYAAKDAISQTVTFKVVNGSWDDGNTADITVTLTGLEGDTLKLAENQIPAVGTKPADTYKAGAWDVVPSTDTAITAATTYTYTYAAKDSISQTVTFKVVNGSWNDETTTDKTVTLTGYEGDTLKLAANQIPAVGDKPGTNYKAGSWNVTPSADTEITADTTYTYTYAQKDAAVVTKAPEAKTMTYNGQAQALVTAGEATGGEMQYALGTKDAANEPYTTTIPAKTEAGTYYVWYMAKGDENHNDSEVNCIPVTITATYTVTYKVVNGTWSDGTTADKTETVQSGSTPASVPTGMIASSGYTGGAWNTNPADAAITEATTFTYTFSAVPTYTVTYKVVNGTWSDGTTADKTETVQSGSTPASVPTGMIASSGYTGGAWNTNPADAAITEATTFTYTFSAVPVTDVTLNADSAVIAVNGTVTLTATVSPDNATDRKVIWSVSAVQTRALRRGGAAVKLYKDAACTEEVGTGATETLTVYALGLEVGDATVTVTSNANSNKYAICTVSVQDIPHTGDTADFGLWAVLLLAGLAGMGIALTAGKRRKEQQ